MNSANVHNPVKSDLGMEVRKPYLARGFRRSTSREAKELPFEGSDARDPEVQHGLNSNRELRAEEGLRKQCPSLDRWVVMG